MRLLWIIAWCLALPGLAAENPIAIDPKSQKAYIRLEGGDKILTNPGSQAQWQQLCQGLGKNLLTTGTSPGFLVEFKCQTEPEPEGFVAKQPWRISIIPKPKFIDIDIQFYANDAWIPVQAFSFRLEKPFLEEMQKPVVIGLLARMMLESLPTGWVYEHKAEAGKIEFTSSPNLPFIPNGLTIYQLRYDPSKNLWLPQVKARLVRNTQVRTVSGLRLESFEWSRIYTPLRDGESYWVQNSKGRNQRQTEFEKKINTEVEGFSLVNLLDRMLFETFTSNYAGIRYGRSFVQGDSVISKTALLSLLLEIRDGPISGLRLYYDLTPKTTHEREGLQEHFRMSRASLGWAWEFTPPESWRFLVSRIDLQPKIGLLNLDSELAVPDSEGEYQLLQFEAKQVINLNAELGIEREILWMRSRLWTSFSSAAISLAKSNGVSVSSLRVGVDGYFDILKRQGWELQVLGFGFAERLTLAREGNTLDMREDQQAIRELGFNLLFVGGGITLSW